MSPISYPAGNAFTTEVNAAMDTWNAVERSNFTFIKLVDTNGTYGENDVNEVVFDEIDAGISGRIAQKTGKVLKALSKTHQIICITHLPQIAAMSDRHFHVSKTEDKERNESVAYIKTLNEKERITEVAKLLSGENVTEESSKSAIELIKA